MASFTVLVFDCWYLKICFLCKHRVNTISMPACLFPQFIVVFENLLHLSFYFKYGMARCVFTYTVNLFETPPCTIDQMITKTARLQRHLDILNFPTEEHIYLLVNATWTNKPIIVIPFVLVSRVDYNLLSLFHFSYLYFSCESFVQSFSCLLFIL